MESDGPSAAWAGGRLPSPGPGALSRGGHRLGSHVALPFQNSFLSGFKVEVSIFP